MNAFARLLYLLAIFAVLIGVVSAQAPDNRPPSETRQRLDAARLELQQVEAALRREGLTDPMLAELRRRIDPIQEVAAEIIGRDTPREAEIKLRLEQLGPKPEPGKAPPESADAARERQEQEARLQEVEETLRSARLVQVSADQIQQAVIDRRRALFAKATLEQSRSIVSPWLWGDVARALPRELRALSFVFGDWIERVQRELDNQEWLLLAAFTGVLLLGALPALRLARRFEAQDISIEAPTRLQRARAALRVALLSAIVPSLICLLAYNFLSLLGILPDRIEAIAQTILAGIALIAVVRGLASGTLAPLRPAWRVFAVSDASATRLVSLATTVPSIVLVGKTLEAINRAIVAGLPLSVATKGTICVLVAASIALTVRRFATRSEDTAAQEGAADGPASDRDKGPPLPLRFAAWVCVFAILGTCVGGYIALAAFLIDQMVWVTSLTVLVTLLLILVDEAVGKGLAAEGRLGRQVRTATGLGRGSMDQIGVLAAGLLRLALFVAAGLLVLAPWGVDTGDFLGSVRAAFFGFQVGNVTISLSTIAIALVLFVFAFLVTRALQRWLETSYLPHTSLDPGLRNSIKTIFGYVGIIIAAALALGQLGLSLDRMTLVAGALSVGIGFGLQSIVNNFVSGLILLWERPLRVGDWIVVGDEQGKVKRINVRATEIETFDRASLIVPNSEFISGRVKNFVHNDRTGRIIIPVGVDYEADPDKVREILSDVALGHREVLTTPKHAVIFKSFGDSSLDFELICFADVDAMFMVRSELMFEIFRRLKAAGIEIPFPRRTVEIANLPALSAQLQEAEFASRDENAPSAKPRQVGSGSPS